MKNIESVLQIKDGVTVISAEDLAALLGRKHLSILRAIDSIPSEYLRKNMFLMVGGEVFLASVGMCILGMSGRHLRVRQRIIIALFKSDANYREARWAEFYAAMPPRIVIKLLLRLDDAKMHSLALMVFKAICWFKRYDPAKTVTHTPT